MGMATRAKDTICDTCRTCHQVLKPTENFLPNLTDLLCLQLRYLDFHILAIYVSMTMTKNVSKPIILPFVHVHRVKIPEFRQTQDLLISSQTLLPLSYLTQVAAECRKILSSTVGDS